jgi:hypothetical protein
MSAVKILAFDDEPEFELLITQASAVRFVKTVRVPKSRIMARKRWRSERYPRLGLTSRQVLAGSARR